MVDYVDASTLTDVCSSSSLPEVELVSIIQDSLPKYKLRALTAPDFSPGYYQHKDWGVKAPQINLHPDQLKLTPEQIEATLKYFVLCGERVTQMTHTYDDIEAVTRLLEEKERDLELAATIGQSLLDQNRELLTEKEDAEALRLDLEDKVKQLSHDLRQKEEILRLFNNEVYEPRGSSPSKEVVANKQIEAAQRRLKRLEEENFSLRSETAQLKNETLEFEAKEHHLTQECVLRLNEAQKRVSELQKELEKKTMESIKHQEESASLLNQLVAGQNKTKELTIENLDLQEHLKATQNTQKELTAEVYELQCKYRECKDMLEETQNEVRELKKKSYPRATPYYYGSAGPLIPPRDSLAAELSDSLMSDSDRSDLSDRRKTNIRKMETAQYVRKLASSSSSTPKGSPSTSVIMSAANFTLPTTTTLSFSTPSAARIHQSSPHTGGQYPAITTHPLLATPIPGSSRRSPAIGSSRHTSLSSQRTPSPRSSVASAQAVKEAPVRPAFLDKVNDLRHSYVGRPGIPGSKDLEKALKRLSLRRQNAESEKQYREMESSIADEVDSRMGDFSSGTATPVQCKTPESELSGYGSGGGPGGGYRLPEKLQIVKPMEGSLTLQHWQRLATPHLGGLLEEREGVQIRGRSDQNLLTRKPTYSMMDPEEDVGIEEPYKGSLRTNHTFTYTNSKVMHPIEGVATRYKPHTSPMTAASSVPTGHKEAGFGSGVGQPGIGHGETTQSRPGLTGIGQSTVGLGGIGQSAVGLGGIGQSAVGLGGMGQSGPGLGGMSQPTVGLGGIGQSGAGLGAIGQSAVGFGGLGQSPVAPPNGVKQRDSVTVSSSTAGANPSYLTSGSTVTSSSRYGSGLIMSMLRYPSSPLTTTMAGGKKPQNFTVSKGMLSGKR